MNNFLTNIYKNVAWITVIDSGRAGKNIWIFAITHGNEPVWIDIFEYLISDFEISKKLEQGKLFLIANNRKAYAKYQETKNTNDYRFLDDNMNRISNQKFKQWSYEFERLSELKQIYGEIDIALDLHSVSQGNDVIWLCDIAYVENAKSFFDVETILVDDMWKTWAVIWEFLRNNKEAYWLECGNHISQDGFEKWKVNVLNFLQYFWALSQTKICTHHDEIYEFIQEIPVKTDNFQFTKNCSWWFTKVWIWEVYAIDWSEKLKNIFSKEIFVGIPMKKPKKWDGAGFLFYKK